MGMLGNLKDMTVADLVQLNCQERRTASLLVQNHKGQGALYFKDGNVVHAEFNGQEGEETADEVLSWEEGTFDLQVGAEAPKVTITRSWSSLLIEGARRLDEKGTGSISFILNPEQIEEKDMTHKLDEILKELAGEVDGYVASNVVGMDGINIAHHATGKTNFEVVSAQMTMLFKLVDTSVNKVSSVVLEDNLLTTTNEYLFTRYLPGHQYFLGVLADRKQANLGNLRLICKIYVDRLAKAMPHND
jgi:predicted regulator of Ras-like GTPase activity (Roadblock/LC7/MglB family)